MLLYIENIKLVVLNDLTKDPAEHYISLGRWVGYVPATKTSVFFISSNVQNSEPKVTGFYRKTLQRLRCYKYDVHEFGLRSMLFRRSDWFVTVTEQTQ